MTTQRGSRAFSRIQFVIASLLLAVASPLALALSVEVEGIAPIADGAPGKARVMAIQDALRQAAMQHSVSVSATTTMSNNTVTGDSARLRANARITNVAVADEWQEDGQYHVLVRAEVEIGEAPAAKTDGARKRIAFLQIGLRDRGAAADLPFIEIEVPRMLRKEMESRLGATGIDASQHLLGNPKQAGYAQPEVPDAGVVTRAAQELGAQFLVTGDVIDTGISDDLVGQSRRIELEFVLYDGISGTALARMRFDERVVGGDQVKVGVSVASREFQESPYGAALNQIVNRAAEGIAAELGQLPFTARVVRANGKKVYIDAGSAARVRVGDMLLAYKVEGASTVDPESGRVLGHAEQPIATLVLRSVQPQFSIGEVETDQVSLKPGDIVRFAW
jgi:hypothetical protein